MSARFWLRSSSVPLTLNQVAELSEEEAMMLLAEMRWGSKTEQVYPDCGVMDSHYFLRTRNQWRCKHCKYTFSVTTNSPFVNHKISYKKLAIAIFAFIIAQKGLPALELKRMIGGDYRTCFTLLGKIRLALMDTMPTEKLNGTVEIDGGHFSGRPRKGRTKPEAAAPEIPKKYQKQHRQKLPKMEFPYHPNRRLVIAMRQNDGTGSGADHTVVAVCRSENAADMEALVLKYVEKGSTIRTDELTAYGNLKYKGFIHETVNHSIEFSTDDGVSQNQAESYFSRLQRACIGIYHRILPKYMLDYAIEMAWREDVRRRDTRKQLGLMVSRIFNAGESRDWVNYSHGHKREAELLFAALPRIPEKEPPQES
jgi:transposase-like protein